MPNILKDSLPRDNNLSINNIQDVANPIKVDKTNNRIDCYYIDSTKKENKLVEIDLKTNITIVRPINTIEESIYFLQPKYEIKEFIFDGFETEIYKTESYEEAIIGLPIGFTKTLKFGLGLEKKYKIIITTLKKHFKECEKIIFSTSKLTGIEKNQIIINEEDFDKIRRGIDRNQDLFQKEAMIAKEHFVYENTLNFINPKDYPKLKSEPRKDSIFSELKFQSGFAA